MSVPNDNDQTNSDSTEPCECQSRFCDDCGPGLRSIYRPLEEPRVEDNDQTSSNSGDPVYDALNDGMYMEPITWIERLVALVDEHNRFFDCSQRQIHWHTHVLDGQRTYYVYRGYSCTYASLVVQSKDLQHVVKVLENEVCNLEELLSSDATISQ